MRTTIVIADTLFRRAQRKARELGLSMSAYLEAAVRKDLTQPAVAPKRKAFRLVTFKGRGLRTGLSWKDVAGQAELAEDLAARRRHE